MNLRRLKCLKIFQIFTIYLRYLIGGAFVFASIVKIEGQRFTTVSGANAPINDSWHLFETLYQSGIYWHFIGWGQLIAGLLLMTQLLATLGAMMFFPIILNIFFITISYPFGGTPIITFLMLMANIYLLLWDWPKIKIAVWPFQSYSNEENYSFMSEQSWIYLGAFYFFLIIFVKLSIHSFFTLLFCFGIACLSGLLLMIYNLKRRHQIKTSGVG